MCSIPINLVYEDSLSQFVLSKLIRFSERPYLISFTYNSGGYGQIKRKINGFNSAARGMPYLVLTDLDQHECAPVLIREWITGTRNNNLILRVAVRQVEAWLLACRSAFAKFLAINEELIPSDVESIPNAKAFLIQLARQSRRRGLKTDIVPAQGSTSKVGPDYNGRMIYFVENFWDPNVAKEVSPSLRRTIAVLDEFEPVFEDSL